MRSIPATENAHPQNRYRAVPNGVTITDHLKATLAVGTPRPGASPGDLDLILDISLRRRYNGSTIKSDSSEPSCR